MLAEIRPVRCLPNANKSVAPSNSHGKTFKKVCPGVLIRRRAPASPPSTLVTIRGIITRREILKRFRYAPPLAVTPTHSASVFVAFAGMGATPVNSSAGNATSCRRRRPRLSRRPARRRKTRRWRVQWSSPLFITIPAHAPVSSPPRLQSGSAASGLFHRAAVSLYLGLLNLRTYGSCRRGQSPAKENEQSQVRRFATGQERHRSANRRSLEGGRIFLSFQKI